jgi:hypothetical protein
VLADHAEATTAGSKAAPLHVPYRFLDTTTMPASHMMKKGRGSSFKQRP